MNETVQYVRGYRAGHRSAHLVPPGAREALCGAREALCGARPREGRSWLGIRPAHAARLEALPDCRYCAVRARVAAALASGSAPGDRPGVVCRVRYHGDLRPVAECARCGQLRPVHRRGLCTGCQRSAEADGTISDYGWTRADRLAEFAGLRGRGLSVAEASARAGVTERTGWRYETALRDSGNALRRDAA